MHVVISILFPHLDFPWASFLEFSFSMKRFPRQISTYDCLFLIHTHKSKLLKTQETMIKSKKRKLIPWRERRKIEDFFQTFLFGGSRLASSFFSFLFFFFFSVKAYLEHERKKKKWPRLCCILPWKRERLLTPVFWPGEFHGLYSPWGRKESDTTERLSQTV